MDSGAKQSFFVRHEFLIRRLHSLSGLIPVGAYMTIHLLTNASVLAGVEIFQKNVDTIHSLGPLLPFVEWTFIFIPILFHGILGVAFIAGAVPNTAEYPYQKNIRYTLQRATGIIAFVFIAYHIWHMHHYGASTGGGNFEPEYASSSVAVALTPFLAKAFYIVGILASVFHLANGIWTMGITWGIWTSPAAQRRADYVCSAFGILLACVGLTAMSAFGDIDVQEARRAEERMRLSKEFAAGEISAEELVASQKESAEDSAGNKEE